MPKDDAERSAESDVIFLGKKEYVHYRDENTGAEVAKIGPEKIILGAHQKLIGGIKQKTQLLGGQFCYVDNPVRRNEDGAVITDEYQQAELKMGEREVRIGGCLFPLYPGEVIVKSTIHNVLVLNRHQAVLVKALMDFVEQRDGVAAQRRSGDEWLVLGPGHYIPPVEVMVLDFNVRAIVLKDSEYCVILNPYDEEKNTVRAGQRKVVEGESSFFLHPGEVLEVPEMIPGDSQDHGSPPEEEVFQHSEYLFGSSGIPAAQRESYLKLCVRKKHVLSRREGLYVQALEALEKTDPEDKKKVIHYKAGQTWLVSGPQTYVPSEKIRILKKIKAISLSQGEGIYIRDLISGVVCLEKGSKELMLKPHQVPFQKDLPLEELLVIELGHISYARAKPEKDPKYCAFLDNKRKEISLRDRSRAVVLNLEAKTIARIVDYEKKASDDSGLTPKANARILYGPVTEMLGPYERVQIFDLSGGKEKRPKQLRVATRALGPDFITDLIVVSTADHTRVQVKVTYKWSFECVGNPAEDEPIFDTPDFIAYVCKSLASKIREIAAKTLFENFHRDSARFIRLAVFGEDSGENPVRMFPEINLKISAVDIENVEPVDEEISKNLQESIKTNIQIQLNATKEEADARARLKKIESEKGESQASSLRDQKKEVEKKLLIELQNENQKMITIEAVKVEAEAKKLAANIANQAIIEQAKARTKASEIEAENNRKLKLADNKVDLEHRHNLMDLEVEREQRLSELRAHEFEKRVQSLGAENIVETVRAQAQAAAVAGIKSTVFLPATSGLNLFSSMESLLGAASTPGTQTPQAVLPDEGSDS